MADWYPALPQPYVQPASERGIMPLALGAQVGLNISDAIGQGQMRQATLDQYRGQLEGQKEYARTGDATKLMEYNPQMVMQLDKAKADMLGKGLDMFDSMTSIQDPKNPDPRAWNATVDALNKLNPAFDGMLRKAEEFKNPVEFGQYVGQMKNRAADAAMQLAQRQSQLQTASKVDLTKKLMPYQKEMTIIDTDQALRKMAMQQKYGLESLDKQQEFQRSLFNKEYDLKKELGKEAKADARLYRLEQDSTKLIMDVEKHYQENMKLLEKQDIMPGSREHVLWSDLNKIQRDNALTEMGSRLGTIAKQTNTEGYVSPVPVKPYSSQYEQLLRTFVMLPEADATQKEKKNKMWEAITKFKLANELK